MKIGDMVFALLDEQRGLEVPGIILEVKKSNRYHEGDMQNDIKVLWSSSSTPIGWWREDQLRVISPAN
jgi:hypothetical protein|tara:strand:- start:10032 stop:10235 length:204 start_codon:yes stop_codon:yes gene_type:complete